MEIWDLYNLNREVIGIHARGTELPENGFHLVVHVWLFPYDGETPLKNATTKEVAQARWMHKEKVAQLRRESKLVYSIKDLDYFFNEME